MNEEKRSTWLDRLAVHRDQTTQMATELYKTIVEAKRLDEIIELPGYDLVIAQHPRLIDRQSEVRERGLDHSDLLGEVTVFKVIADDILMDYGLCLRY